MKNYLLKRLAQAFLTFIAVISIAFCFITSSDYYFYQKEIAAFPNPSFDRNLPSYQRLAFYLNDISPISVYKSQRFEERKLQGLTLDIGDYLIAFKKPHFGHDFATQELVREVINRYLSGSFWLIVVTTIVIIILGQFIGLFTIYQPTSTFTKWMLRACLFWQSIHIIIIAIVLSFVLGFKLNEHLHLPMLGFWMVKTSSTTYAIDWTYIVLPTLSLAIRPMGYFILRYHHTYLDLGLDQVSNVQKKIPFNQLFTTHYHILIKMMKPGLYPLKSWMLELVGGLFFVEFLYGWRGIGELFFNSIMEYRWPVTIAIVYYVSAFIIIIYALQDVFYRARMGYSAEELQKI